MHSGVWGFVHYYSQMEDFEQAILYAEQYIIPELQNNAKRQKLTPEIFENWLKTLHCIGAQTIMSDYGQFGTLPGQYTDRTIIRIETGLKGIERDLNTAYDRKVSHDIIDSEVNAILEKYNLSEISETWHSLVKKIRDGIYKVPDYLAADNYLSKETAVDVKGDFFNKILDIIKYYCEKELLTDKEKTDLGKIIIIINYKDIENKMKEYSQSMVSKIKTCPPDDAVKLAADIYKDLLFIHPFQNANGRIATILLNCILLIFLDHSILLRTVGDKTNPNSQYNLVMTHMRNDPELIYQYVADKLRNNRPRDEVSLKLDELRPELYQLKDEMETALKKEAPRDDPYILPGTPKILNVLFCLKLDVIADKLNMDRSVFSYPNFKNGVSLEEMKSNHRLIISNYSVESTKSKSVMFSNKSKTPNDKSLQKIKKEIDAKAKDEPYAGLKKGFLNEKSETEILKKSYCGFKPGFL